jgi:GNAT superfamily N-acetyltransferase
VEDGELARRSVASFGEMLATVGRCGVGPAAEVRRPDAVGATIGALGANPWLNAAVVPSDAEPPTDDPQLPYCLWTLRRQVRGRVEDRGIATPCMGLLLDDAPRPDDGGSADITSPTFGEVGAINDRAYGSGPALGPLAARLDDDRLRSHGLHVSGRLVCVAITLVLGDDLGIHYVATEADHRRQGLATRLLTGLLDRAGADGMRTATLQASPDGRPVYRRMGFREVDLLHGFVRDPDPDGTR